MRKLYEFLSVNFRALSIINRRSASLCGLIAATFFLFLPVIQCKTVTIINESPYTFSVYKNKKMIDVANSFYHDFEHISGKEGIGSNSITIDVEDEDRYHLYFYLDRQNLIDEPINKANFGAESVALYANFKKLFSSLSEYTDQAFLSEYSHYLSGFVVTAFMGYKYFANPYFFSRLSYVYINEDNQDYKIILKSSSQGKKFFVEKLIES